MTKQHFVVELNAAARVSRTELAGSIVDDLLASFSPSVDDQEVAAQNKKACESDRCKPDKKRFLFQARVIEEPRQSWNRGGENKYREKCFREMSAFNSSEKFSSDQKLFGFVGKDQILQKVFYI